MTEMGFAPKEVIPAQVCRLEDLVRLLASPGEKEQKGVA
jgi:hypothetical protein